MISGDSGENQQAIQRLSEARAAIQGHVDGIDGQVGNLEQQFRGLDGLAYSDLLKDWLGHVMKIVNDLSRIIDTYGDTARMQSDQTATSTDAVIARRAAHNALMGG
ncbi:hypothetical protein ADL00_42355 [Streptomyces sp. AS58]|uniref:Uncharacterized protein n=2 Tax=Streptomyces TaxID=1883 RepID=A0A2Z4JFB2_9ACTN|nr:hypothetical protein DN051_43185 [Streptomyces cadmiisoli]KOV51148.1 hypothetical protein ADL00_42355 [Streptomyces sp. AS58]